MASAAEQLAANLNFGALAKADELKKRIWFTLGALLVYRLGTYIPLPGINPDAVTDLFRQQGQAGVLGLFNMFSGGAVGRLAIFALAIMPYISASIIVQLLSSVIPSFEALKKEGEQGRKIINQYTRYGTVLLVSALVGWALIGLAAGFLMGDVRGWRQEPRKRRAFFWLTIAWAALFFARLAVQLPLYFSGNVQALGTLKLVMGLPLFAPMVALTWLVVRALYPAGRDAEAVAEPSDPAS